MNSLLRPALLCVLAGCEVGGTFPNTAPIVPEQSYIDVNGRVTTAVDGEVPTAVQELSFGVADLPATFVVHRGKYVPQWVVRQKSHAAWAGRADAHYLIARASSFDVGTVPKVAVLEEARLDPVKLRKRRELRWATVQSPTASDFFAPPISKVIVTKSRESAGPLATPGTQILLEEQGRDWIEAVQKKTGATELPMVITSDQIVSGK